MLALQSRASDSKWGDVTQEVSSVIPEEASSAKPRTRVLVVAGTDIIDLAVSWEPPLIVPEVVGKTEAGARFTLTEAGFQTSQISIERRPSGEVEEGLSSRPTRQREKRSDLVEWSLWLSVGSHPCGRSRCHRRVAEVAQVMLEDFGFEVVFDAEIESPGTIRSTAWWPSKTPPPDRHWSSGRVTLRIGRAATAAPVPAVVGDAEAAARTEVESAGFVWAKEQTRCSLPATATSGASCLRTRPPEPTDLSARWSR